MCGLDRVWCPPRLGLVHPTLAKPSTRPQYGKESSGSADEQCRRLWARQVQSQDVRPGIFNKVLKVLLPYVRTRSGLVSTPFRFGPSHTLLQNPVLGPSMVKKAVEAPTNNVVAFGRVKSNLKNVYGC
jgi:hypothetical protein